MVDGVQFFDVEIGCELVLGFQLFGVWIYYVVDFDECDVVQDEWCDGCGEVYVGGEVVGCYYVVVVCGCVYVGEDVVVGYVDGVGLVFFVEWFVGYVECCVVQNFGCVELLQIVGIGWVVCYGDDLVFELCEEGCCDVVYVVGCVGYDDFVVVWLYVVLFQCYYVQYCGVVGCVDGYCLLW